ncbi:MAG: hypothetical protein HQL87_17195 [Magnetococcales bacterium]|nr:hypothetical protein [Magnetococcales bacterium]
MSAAETNTLFPQNDAENASATEQTELILIEEEDLPPAATVEHLESSEQIIPPIQTEEPVATAEAAAPVQTVTVLIEPLGDGIANLLADMVGQVVLVAKAFPGMAKVKEACPCPLTTLRHEVKTGVREAVAGAGNLAQNSANIMVGLAGCLRASVHCMGRVIMQPAPRSCCGKQPTPEKTAQTTT